MRQAVIPSNRLHILLKLDNSKHIIDLQSAAQAQHAAVRQCG